MEVSTRNDVYLGITGVVWVFIQGIVLVQQGDGTDQAGLVVGTLATAGICAYSLKRAIDTPFDPEDWPGKKAWPALTVLLSIFATSIFLQGLASSFA